MNIVYSSSNAYCKYAGISIISLLENNKDVKEINIYFIGVDLSEDNKEKIRHICEKYGRFIEIIDANETFEQFKKKYKMKSLRNSYSTYSKILLSYLLPKIEKVISLDADTVVRGDLSGLWDADMNGKLIAGVPDIGVYAKKSFIESPELIDSLDYYINAGVLVVDLKKWRELDLDSYLLDCISLEKETFKCAEQSIINKYLSNYICRIDLKYNCYSTIHNPSVKEIQKVFSKKQIFKDDEIDFARNNPIIVHFLGHPYERPWYKHSFNRFKKEFLHYKSMSVWDNDKMEKWNKNIKFIRRLYDSFCLLLLKLHMFNRWLHFRYVIGQKMKGKVTKN